MCRTLCMRVSASLLWTLLYIVFFVAPIRAQRTAATPYVTDEVLVFYKDGASLRPGRAPTVSRSAVVQTIEESKMQRLRLPAGTSVSSALATLSKNSAVAYAQPNYIHRVCNLPNDSLFVNGGMWGLRNAGQESGSAGADIAATAAWALCTGSPGIAVATIDSGVDYTHPDLVPNIWTNLRERAGNGRDDDGNGYVDDVHGWNAVDHNGNVMDTMGHGTHVAGTIGAMGNNGIGVTGVCWRTSIVACKFIGPSGTGTTAAAIECMRYLIKLKETGVNIVAINASWGSMGWDQALHDMIDECGRHNMLFVCAAGNGDDQGRAVDVDRNAECPASFGNSNLIAVTATDRWDHRAPWANYGAKNVALGAPGVDIWSTLPGNSYGSYNGTSMAAPHVTGAAALVASYYPWMNAATIKARILAAADPVDGLAGATATGGRLNLYKALSAPSTSVQPAPPTLQVALTLGKAVYRLGDTASLTVTAATRAGAVATGAQVRLDILTPSGRVITDRATVDATGRVTFRALLPVWMGKGTYKVAVTAQQPSGATGAVVTAFTAS